MKKHTTTLLSRMLMAIILFAISPACTDNYEDGMQLTDEYLLAYLGSDYIDKSGGDGHISISYEGNRFTLTGTPEWITLGNLNFESGHNYYGTEGLTYHAEPNWTGSTREATLKLTAYSSDGVSVSDEETFTQRSYTYDDLFAYIRCTSSSNFSNGDSGDGILHITYRGGSFEIIGIPDWMTIESYEFKKCTDYNIGDDLVIHADANYTGSTRYATITLISYLGDGKNHSNSVYLYQYSK